jgi:hypothetical protein
LSYLLRDGQQGTFRFPEVDTYVEEIGYFARCLRDGSRPLHTEVEGIQVLTMILAAYEGARTGTIATILPT